MLLLQTLDESPLLNRVASIGSVSEASLKRADLKDLRICDAMRLFLSIQIPVPMNIAGSFLLGTTRIYSKKLEVLQQRMVLVMENGYLVSEAPTKPVPGSTTRKRPVSHQTPLQTVPENGALFLQDVAFDDAPASLTTLSVGRTPYSSRKRLFGTPRSQSIEDDPPEFESTTMVMLHTPMQEFADSNRRLSSVTEVMDSLRADDGQRRLSNLMGSGDIEVPPSPFDTSELIDPVSPWLFQTPPSVGMKVKTRIRGRAQTKKRSLMDKKGRWGIEINPSDLESRKMWYLSNPFYMRTKRIHGIYRLHVRELLNDTTGHFAWYKKPNFSMQSDAYNESFGEGIDDDCIDAVPSSPPFPIREEALEEKLKNSSEKNVGKALEYISNKRRTEMVSNFVGLLALASQGKIGFSRSSEVLGFNNNSLNSPLIEIL